MNDIQSALDILQEFGGINRVTNEARVPSDYLFRSRVLPERGRASYHAEDTGLVVSATMAGLVSMDSYYPQGGALSISTWRERTFKLGIESVFGEQQTRELQELAMRIQASGGSVSTSEQLLEEVLNWYDLGLLQAVYDTEEYLCAQALAYGEIAWTNNGLEIGVEYGVPVGNIFNTQTGPNGYGGTTSQFWADNRKVKRLLSGGIALRVCNSNTWGAIIENPANRIRVTEENDNVYSITRYVGTEGEGRTSEDKRDTATFLVYDREATAKNPETGALKDIAFVPDGAIINIGKPKRRSRVIKAGALGSGSQEGDALREADAELGYFHLGPTVEAQHLYGDAMPGRFGRIYSPEKTPHLLVGQMAENVMPVIQNPKGLVTQWTEIV